MGYCEYVCELMYGLGFQDIPFHIKVVVAGTSNCNTLLKCWCKSPMNHRRLGLAAVVAFSKSTQIHTPICSFKPFPSSPVYRFGGKIIWKSLFITCFCHTFSLSPSLLCAYFWRELITCYILSCIILIKFNVPLEYSVYLRSIRMRCGCFYPWLYSIISP